MFSSIARRVHTGCNNPDLFKCQRKALSNVATLPKPPWGKETWSSSDSRCKNWCGDSGDAAQLPPSQHAERPSPCRLLRKKLR